MGTDLLLTSLDFVVSGIVFVVFSSWCARAVVVSHSLPLPLPPPLSSPMSTPLSPSLPSPLSPPLPLSLSPPLSLSSPLPLSPPLTPSMSLSSPPPLPPSLPPSLLSLGLVALERLGLAGYLLFRYAGVKER